MTQATVGSLFSGIGGFDLGLEQAGFRIAWQCEIDPFCRKVLDKHWPGVQKYGDIREVNPDELEAVDLVCGGFPCQDLSVAGKRKGLAGERSGLFFEFLRIVAAIRPGWFLIENVPGLLSSWCPVEPPPYKIPTRRFDTEEDAQRWADSLDGRWDVEERSDFARVLAPLAELGYCVAWRVLDAQYFGVAQRRSRVFIVGSFGTRGALEVFFEPDCLPGDTAPGREAGKGSARCLTAGTRMDGDTENFTTQALTGTFANGGADDNKAQAGFLVAAPLTGKPWADNESQESRLVVHGLTARHDSSEDGTGRGVPLVCGPLTGGSGERGWKVNAENAADGQLVVVPTLRTNYRNNSNPVTEANMLVCGYQGTDLAHAVRANPSKADKPDSSTYIIQDARDADKAQHGIGITEGGPCYTLDGVSQHAIAQRLGVRRLSPTECERLQGLPNAWTLLDDKTPDSPRYRTVGDAVCRNAAIWIGKRLYPLIMREKGVIA